MSPIREHILEFRILTLRDKEAFGEYYELQKLPIYRFVLSRTGSQEIAEDLTSEVFLKTCQYIFEEKRQIIHLRGLIFSIARTVVVDYFRKFQKHEHVIDPDDLVFKNAVDESASVVEETDTKMDLKNLENALRGIKHEYKEIIALRFIDGLSIEEMAVVLGKSRGAVRVMLHRALRELEREYHGG